MWDTFGPLEMFAMTNRILDLGGEHPAFKLWVVSEDKTTLSFGGPAFEADVAESQVVQNRVTDSEGIR